MVSSRRAAFTLGELLVVTAVIGLLMALFVRFLSLRDEAFRRAQCQNNMKQIALAGALNYAADFNAYPGYWMPATATKPIGTTWPLTLSKYLERQDIWNVWIGAGPTAPAGIPRTLYWDLMVCPSDPPMTNQGQWLSYVVNCGLYGNNANPADGVCFDQLATPPGPKVSGDFLLAGKGESYTLFGSENTLGIVTGNSAGWIQSTSTAALQYTGFCWQAVVTPNVAQQINGDKSNSSPPMAGTVLPDYARPASYHPGGVNVVFCDGHVQFLREDVTYSIYQVLMAPDPPKADFPAGSAAIGYDPKDGDD